MNVSLKFRSFIALLMAAVLLLLPNSAAFAAKKDYPDPQIKITHARQEKTQWCWAATSVMLLDALKNVKMTQTEYAIYANNSDLNETLLRGEFINRLKEKGIYGDRIEGPATWDEIKSSIDKGYPVVVFQKKKSGNGHILIINGYYTKPNDSEKYLIINDPQVNEDWFTYDEIAKATTMKWDSSWINVRTTIKSK